MNRKWLFPFWKIPFVEKFIEYKILKGHRCISHNTAKKKAIVEYEEYNKCQKKFMIFIKKYERL